MLLFNKQYRAECKLFDELARKIRKSKDIKYEIVRNSTICKLDSIDITFHSNKRLLEVKDKKGDVIISLNCQFSGTPYNTEMELSNARFNMYCHLHHTAGKRHDVLMQKEKMEEATRQAQAKISEKKKAETEKVLKEVAVTKAYERLRGL